MVRSTWGEFSAPPFFGQIAFEPELAAELTASVRNAIRGSGRHCEVAFRDAPYACVWVVLTALAASYGDDGASVYIHISHALDLDLSDQKVREKFKSSYIRASRKIGLRLPGVSLPTEIFFTQVGVADAQSGRLAHAFLNSAKALGPPPEEDVAELRIWQRRATKDGLETFARMQAALEFDSHGHYARLFCSWKAGDPPQNRASRAFFLELDRAANLLGVEASRLVAEPAIMWTELGLALMARPSHTTQTIVYDSMPYRLPASAPWPAPLPWQDHVTWKAGSLVREIRLTPRVGEIFVFALDNQKLVARLTKLRTTAALACRNALLLGAEPFISWTETGPIKSLAQGAAHLAIVDIGVDPITIEGSGFGAVIQRDLEPSIRIDGPVIGRMGAYPLYGSRSVVEITSGINAAENDRILRIGFAGRSWFSETIAFDARGMALLPIASLGLDGCRDPGRIQLELLVKGVGARSGVRAEIVGRFYIWPATEHLDLETPFATYRVPANYLANTSEHLLIIDGGLVIDPGRGFRHAVLSLLIEGRQRDFAIPVRGTRLFHHAISGDKPSPIELGSIFTLGHAERQDSLMVRSTDRQADLWIRGTLVRRPFMARTSWEIPPSQISPEMPVDDQIALFHSNGRRELLCRISQPIEPRRIVIAITENRIAARLELPVTCDAIGLELWREGGEIPEIAAVALGGTPLDEPTPSWLTATIHSGSPNVVELTIDRRAWVLRAAVGLLVIRRAADDVFERLEDSRGRVVAIPLAADKIRPYVGHPAKPLAQLSCILATSYQPDCDRVIREVLGCRLREVVSKVTQSGLYSPLLRPIFTSPLHGEGAFISRLDLLSPDLAPEVFSSGRATFSVLAGLPRAERLASLARDRDARFPRPVVSHEVSTEIGTVATWLEKADALPEDDPLSGAALRQAFLLFRQIARTSDFFFCLEHETIGQAMKQVLNVYASSRDALRAYDEAAGTDRTGILVAAFLSSFARAARMSKARDFHNDVARRTGLPVAHVTPVTSLAVQVGSELFAYFMSFWEHVEIEIPTKEKRT